MFINTFDLKIYLLAREKKVILVCPLDWGIGHASRCVPVVRGLLERGARVMIGAAGRPLHFLRQSFPDLDFIDFPGARIQYPSGASMARKMAIQAPALLAAIRREHRKLGHLINHHHIDAVISDNRFGLWTKKIPCFYITHQLRILTPPGLNFMEPWLIRLHGHFIRRYHQCWIPDYPGEFNLAGKLSHPDKLPENCRYIGPLSRFLPAMDKEMASPGGTAPDILALLSGPEPQRTILERIVLEQLKDLPQVTAVILQGLPGEKELQPTTDRIRIFPHLPDHDLFPYLINSRLILCRSGYSTIMDLEAAGRLAVLIPTPGQTEQEYLARSLAEKSGCRLARQDSLNINELLKAPGLHPTIRSGNQHEMHLLEPALNSLFSLL